MFPNLYLYFIPINKHFTVYISIILAYISYTLIPKSTRFTIFISAILTYIKCFLITFNVTMSSYN